MKLVIEVLPQSFSVCRFPSDTPCSAVSSVPGVWFAARTDGELSLVCETAQTALPGFLPEKKEDGWRAFRVAGQLDFSLLGILARLTALLADAGVSVFAVSTFDTDYILVREHALETALAALGDGGCEIVRL